MKKYLLLITAGLIAVVANAQVNLNNGLIVYYPFSGNYNDASGNNNNGSAIGNVTLTNDENGNPNSAAAFDGASYISVPAANDLTAGVHFSIAFRFKTNATAGQCLISKVVYDNAEQMQYQLGFDQPVVGSNNLFFATMHDNDCIQTSPLASDYAYGSAISDSTWYCVVMTFDSGVKKIYVDGSMVGQSVVSNSLPNPYSTNTCSGGALELGAWWAQDTRYFNGVMDEVRIYNRQLDSSEITALCTANNTGVANIDNNDRVAIYPNPVASELSVSVPQTKNVNIVVFNELGQQLISQKASDKVTQINIKNLPAGLYMVQVEGDNINVVKQIVKE